MTLMLFSCEWTSFRWHYEKIECVSRNWNSTFWFFTEKSNFGSNFMLLYRVHCTHYSTIQFKYIKVSTGFCQRYNGAVTERLRNAVSRNQTNNGWYFLQLQPAAPSAKLPAGFEVLPFNGASKSCRRRRSGRASTGSSPPCPSPSSRSRSEHSWWSSAANLSVQEINY